MLKQDSRRNNSINFQDFMVDEANFGQGKELAQKRSIREMFENEVFAGAGPADFPDCLA
jgi:hypothetical protein